MNAFRPICQLCKRPFNPQSPGATSDFGPTCAKKALSFAGSVSPQMSFKESDSVKAPKPKPEILKTHVRPVVLSQQTQSLYEPAKVAFEEIYRNFLSEKDVSYGEAAQKKYQVLLSRADVEVFSLEDSQLDWLQSDDRVSLIRCIQSEELYYFRKLNGSYTLLELDTDTSPLLKELVSQITKYTYHQRLQRKQQGEYQLSLFEQA